MGSSLAQGPPRPGEGVQRRLTRATLRGRGSSGALPERPAGAYCLGQSLEPETLQRSLALGVCAALLLTAPALAHHSGAMFDRTKEVTIAGTVKDFQWTNPHSSF